MNRAGSALKHALIIHFTKLMRMQNISGYSLEYCFKKGVIMGVNGDKEIPARPRQANQIVKGSF